MLRLNDFKTAVTHAGDAMSANKTVWSGVARKMQ